MAAFIAITSHSRRKHGRDLGLTIDAISRLLDLSGHPDRPCQNADRIAGAHLASVREKIASLRKLEAELERIATHCGSSTVSDCYVIRALASHELCADEHDRVI